MVVARTPARCGGYIQSEKWRTSTGPRNRSTGGLPSRLQACRQKCARGRKRRRTSTGIPSSAAGIALRPFELVGANATISCSPPAAAAASPVSDPRM